MRAFIGIDFDERAKQKILDLQKAYREPARKGRWKHRDNFHITLKFLPEVTVEQKSMIDHIMTEICSSFTPFELSLTEPGTFGGRDSIRVLWLGVSGNTIRLHSLQNEIELALLSMGFPRESRKYNPHITIGQDIIFEESFEKVSKYVGHFEFEPIRVKDLYLFKSEQIQNKRIYTKISRYELP